MRWGSSAGNIQHRSRSTIHEQRIHREAEVSRDRDQHGQQGASDRQRDDRASLENREIRGGLSQGIRDRNRFTKGLRSYFDFYANERKHSSLDRQTPAEVYRSGRSKRLALSI